MASEKAPAFQFYPKDFLSSSRVNRMSHSEIGIYTVLLCHAWLSDGLPTNVAELAKLVRLPRLRFERIWHGPLSECFTDLNGRLVNARQEIERGKQAERREQLAENGRKGGRPKANGSVQKTKRLARNNQKQSLSSSSSSSSSSSVSDLQSPEERTTVCAESHDDSTPIVVTFPVDGDSTKPEWTLRQSRVDEWVTAYPALDVIAECRKALVWVNASPERRKTAKGMPRFLVNWLNNSTNRGGRSVPNAQARMPAWAARAKGLV